MNKNLYAIYDRTAKNFMNPLHFINHGDAIRWFTTVVNTNDGKNNVSEYPEQFILWYLGVYDDQTAKFTGEKEEVVEGQQVKERVEVYTINQLFELVKNQKH